MLSADQVDIIRKAHNGQSDYPDLNYGYIKSAFNGDIRRGWLLDMSYNLHEQLAKFRILERYLSGFIVDEETGELVALGQIDQQDEYLTISKEYEKYVQVQEAAGYSYSIDYPLTVEVGPRKKYKIDTIRLMYE